LIKRWKPAVSSWPPKETVRVMPTQVRLTRTINLPDRLRLARYQRAPELGPRVFFFSGGSALGPLSRRLISYTHNSIHLITPFDSGGSSAKLRKAFGMLAVGDLRNRLMALADQSVTGNPAITRLFALRLPKSGDAAKPERLTARLQDMVRGQDELVRAVPDPMRKIIRNHLGYFAERMPADFDLRGASLGNLVLAGGYLNNNRHIDPVVFLFSKLAEVRGVVRPVLNKHLHLAADLADGSTIVGQHLLTGREIPPLTSPIKKLYLCHGEDTDKCSHEVEVGIREKVSKLIQSAELICYPMGSFYTSLIANLLPTGVGACVAQTDCPKVYVPNTAADNEQVGMSVADCVNRLLAYLRQSSGKDESIDKFLNLVLVDTAGGSYPGGLDLAAIRHLGVQVVDLPLVSEASQPYVDEERLIEALLSFV
jgi:CofD-related protein of GAK system